MPSGGGVHILLTLYCHSSADPTFCAENMSVPPQFGAGSNQLAEAGTSDRLCQPGRCFWHRTSHSVATCLITRILDLVAAAEMRWELRPSPEPQWPHRVQGAGFAYFLQPLQHVCSVRDGAVRKLPGVRPQLLFPAAGQCDASIPESRQPKPPWAPRAALCCTTRATCAELSTPGSAQSN